MIKQYAEEEQEVQKQQNRSGTNCLTLISGTTKPHNDNTPGLMHKWEQITTVFFLISQWLKANIRKLSS